MPNLISKKIIFSTIIFLSYSYIAGQSEVAIVPDKIKVGDVAPLWVLPTEPDKQNLNKVEFLHNWAEKNGSNLLNPKINSNRHVVVMSFSASWCPPCKKELTILNNIYNDYTGKEVKFFIIDITEATRDSDKEMFKNAPKIKDFLNELGVDIPVLYDIRGKVKENYGLTGIPTLYVIDKYRIIRMMKIGWDDETKDEYVLDIKSLLNKLLKE